MLFLVAVILSNVCRALKEIGLLDPSSLEKINTALRMCNLEILRSQVLVGFLAPARFTDGVGTRSLAV